jgi:hypothetical protein
MADEYVPTTTTDSTIEPIRYHKTTARYAGPMPPPKPASEVDIMVYGARVRVCSAVSGNFSVNVKFDDNQPPIYVAYLSGRPVNEAIMECLDILRNQVPEWGEMVDKLNGKKLEEPVDYTEAEVLKRLAEESARFYKVPVGSLMPGIKSVYEKEYAKYCKAVYSTDKEDSKRMSDGGFDPGVLGTFGGAGT